MKRNIFILLISVLFISCEKAFDIKLDDFDVSLINNPTKVGDTAKFTIKGNPDFITFYLGDKGSNFDYRSRSSADSCLPQLSFTTSVQDWSALHPNSLSLLVSTNYNEDTLNIASSTWQDITNRAVLATSNTTTASGTINLNDFNKSDSIYIAFRYNTSSGINAIQPSWVVQNFSLRNMSFPDSVIHNMVTQSNTGWQAADINLRNNRWQITGTQLSIRGSAALADANDDWVITKVYPKRVNPDRGLPIKQIFDKLNSYSYIFNKPGKYIVAFVASNKNYKSEYEVVKRIEINISK